MKAPSILTKPGLRERVEAAYEIFGDSPGMFKLVKRFILEQGEWEFEQEVINHPYGMEIKELGRGFPDDELKAWCDKHLDPSDYILMPINAMGKYADKWNWIFFKEKDKLVMCKLVWG